MREDCAVIVQTRFILICDNTDANPHISAMILFSSHSNLLILSCDRRHLCCFITGIQIWQKPKYGLVNKCPPLWKTNREQTASKKSMVLSHWVKTKSEWSVCITQHWNAIRNYLMLVIQLRLNFFFNNSCFRLDAFLEFSKFAKMISNTARKVIADF